jgi:hypothetical protein
MSYIDNLDDYLNFAKNPYDLKYKNYINDPYSKYYDLIPGTDVTFVPGIFLPIELFQKIFLDQYTNNKTNKSSQTLNKTVKPEIKLEKINSSETKSNNSNINLNNNSSNINSNNNNSNINSNSNSKTNTIFNGTIKLQNNNTNFKEKTYEDEVDEKRNMKNLELTN